MKKIATLLFWVLALSTAGHSQTTKGEPIVPFTLQDLSGTFHSPNKYRGKVLAVYLFGHD